MADHDDCGAHRILSPTYRIGVVGHRLDRLPADEAGRRAIASRLFAILARIRDAARADQAARLVAVTPLAEGSDRLFAHAALALGYALDVPLPFAQVEYEADFGPPDGPSLAEFRSLLAEARARGVVRELAGRRAAADAAYGAAGRAVIAGADLLVAVWDGQAAKGPGGTAETVAEAIGRGLPVIRIDSRAPYGWSKLSAMADARDEDLSTDSARLADVAAAIVHSRPKR
jgi:hypothetical protein